MIATSLGSLLAGRTGQERGRKERGRKERGRKERGRKKRGRKERGRKERGDWGKGNRGKTPMHVLAMFGSRPSSYSLSLSYSLSYFSPLLFS